jgi:hypothetical protein
MLKLAEANRAVKAGGTKEEIVDALGVAITKR